ncbi:hypothetical protein B2J93_8451 [Marssonina coronariae]|uniref:Uncharacterized protein n=1 Tax=Diplocarpon coronariae TaxID=2795749 RepID=A0A218YZH3_9HELO|nr:hypothetical protein B2J93_8451 [Marssonina coronariae]
MSAEGSYTSEINGHCAVGQDKNFCSSYLSQICPPQYTDHFDDDANRINEASCAGKGFKTPGGAVRGSRRVVGGATPPWLSAWLATSDSEEGQRAAGCDVSRRTRTLDEDGERGQARGPGHVISDFTWSSALHGRSGTVTYLIYPTN